MGFLDGMVAENLPYLILGLAITLEVSLVAIALGVIGGMMLNFMSMSHSALPRKFVTGYISIFRGTPILLQLLIVYYVPSSIDLNLNPHVAAIAALAMNTSAFQAEIYRGGFASIPPGQLEAAGMVGMGRLTTFLHIQVPQVFRLVLPALFNEVILVLKASSLVSVISVTDLTRRAQEIVSSTQLPMQVYVLAAIFYIVVNTLLALLGRMMERRLGSAGR